jgi:hypothetical protein
MKAFKPKLDVNIGGNAGEESALGGGCEGPELVTEDPVVMIRNRESTPDP